MTRASAYPTAGNVSADLLVAQPALRLLDDLTIDRPAPADPYDLLTVSVERVLTGADADEAWVTYRDSLAPLGTVAAMKQVLAEPELRAALADPDIVKYVGRTGDGTVVAVLTLTSKLSTENVNKGFYAERYPEHCAAGRLRYLGYLVVRPEAQARGLIMTLVGRLVADLEAEGAVVVFDVCGYNDETFAFARLCRLVAARTRPAVLATLDVQTYYAIEFPALPA